MNQRLIGAIKTELLKKVSIRKLFMLVSLSIFSLLFSTSNCPTFLQPYNFYIFTFPLRLITHTIDKSCIFLLCNGILVFLVKTSGLIKGSSFRRKKKEINYGSAEPVLQFKLDYPDESLLGTLSASDGVTTKPAEEVEGERISTAEREEEEKEVIGESVISQGNFLWEDSEHDKRFELEEFEEDNDDTVWNTPMSTDELNKKFDEFIRKMKEEINLEDQQKLVMVK